MSSTFLERELFERIGYSTVSDSTFLIDKRRKGYINATHLPKRHRGEEECNEHGCKNKEGETEAGRGGQR